MFQTRQIKLCLSAIFFVGIACWRAVSGKTGSSLVILYYHGVASSKRASFVRQLASLEKRSEVVPADAGNSKAKRRRVAITFDDGLMSVVENAVPELLKRRMPFTIFFPTGALGRTPSWETEAAHDSQDPVMGSELLRGLPAGLATIGSHSVSHPHLTRVTIGDARREIAESKAFLEHLTGQEVSLFAFPYGDHNDEVVELCREVGFRHAYSIQPRVVDTRRNDFLRGRVSINPEDGPIEFYLKSSGAYAWLAALASFRRRARSMLSSDSRTTTHPSAADR
jgi:peptidoglycan/xylan/chitin deacetylase (PgdA/CDA1 family)